MVLRPRLSPGLPFSDGSVGNLRRVVLVVLPIVYNTMVQMTLTSWLGEQVEPPEILAVP